MRISDWSSDVCSSDLCAATNVGRASLFPARRSISGQVRRTIPKRAAHKSKILLQFRSPLGVNRCAGKQIAPDFFGLLQLPRLSERQSIEIRRRRLLRGQTHRLAECKLGRVRKNADRKSVVWGKSESVRVEHGGMCIIKRKNQHMI